MVDIINIRIAPKTIQTKTIGIITEAVMEEEDSDQITTVAEKIHKKRMDKSEMRNV